MARKFELSLSCTLSCLRLEGLKIKNKQRKDSQATYDGKDVFLLLPIQGTEISVFITVCSLLFDNKQKLWVSAT